jgi:hypothetical protein
MTHKKMRRSQKMRQGVFAPQRFFLARGETAASSSAQTREGEGRPMEILRNLECTQGEQGVDEGQTLEQITLARSGASPAIHNYITGVVGST